VALLALVTLSGLSLGAGAVEGHPTATTATPMPFATTTTPPTATTATPTATPTTPPGLVASSRAAGERVYALPDGNAGLMMPAVDAQGNIWVGEMERNRLARLDSHTGQVREWEAPNGQYAIMQTLADGNGRIWFTEDAANYIGQFDPATETFQTYPLGSFNGQRFGPQDLVFDTHGQLWFTGLESGRIGRLDPTTGALQSWPVPTAQAGKPATPYSLAVAADGRVWFGELGGAVGWLDPTTGATQLFPLKNAGAAVFSMAADDRGHVWFTELSGSHLGRIDLATRQVTEFAVPTMLGKPDGLYQLVIAADGGVWFACSGVNSLIRYAPDTGVYTFYQLAAPDSVPYGLALDRSGTLWLTADGTPNYIASVHP
jgi:virginiamycin B lyase